MLYFHLISARLRFKWVLPNVGVSRGRIKEEVIILGWNREPATVFPFLFFFSFLHGNIWCCQPWYIRSYFLWSFSLSFFDCLVTINVLVTLFWGDDAVCTSHYGWRTGSDNQISTFQEGDCAVVHYTNNPNFQKYISLCPWVKIQPLARTQFWSCYPSGPYLQWDWIILSFQYIIFYGL